MTASIPLDPPGGGRGWATFDQPTLLLLFDLDRLEAYTEAFFAPSEAGVVRAVGAFVTLAFGLEPRLERWLRQMSFRPADWPEEAVLLNAARADLRQLGEAFPRTASLADKVQLLRRAWEVVAQLRMLVRVIAEDHASRRT